MNWKIGLDKYLTTPPDDGFDNWCEDVLENKISDSFFYQNSNWIMESNGVCTKWLNKLFNKNKTSKETAIIIERAYRIYSKK